MSPWKFWPGVAMVLLLMGFAVVLDFQDDDPPLISRPLPSGTPSDTRALRCESPGPTLSPSATPEAIPRAIARGWRVRTFPSHNIHEFSDIAVARDGSVWVAGSRRRADPLVACATSYPVVRRWDGRAWHDLSAPPELGALDAVAVAGETAWVFGQCRDAADPDAACYARWTGARWQGGTLESGLSIRDAVALNDGQAWAIPEPDRDNKGWVLHWDGRSWRKMALPFEPWAVGASEHGGVWAVGAIWGEGEHARQAMARWDGGDWRSLLMPLRAKGLQSMLTQVVVEESGQVWMLGESWRICLDEEGEAVCDEGAYVRRRNARGSSDRPTGLWLQKDGALLSYRSTGFWETVARMDVRALAVADRALWAAGLVSYAGWTSDMHSYGAVWRAEP